MIYDVLDVSKNIRKLRKLNNMNQSDLCEKLHKGRNTVSQWEQGKLSTMSIDDLFNLCNIYNCTVNDILGGEKTQILLDDLSKYKAMIDTIKEVIK